MWPSEVDLLSFISSSKPSGKKETYLRILAWRTANDAWRYHPFAKSRFSEEQKNNMRTLSHLLDDTDEIQRILKAEIARELGEFNNCKRLLSYAFADQFSYAASIIRQLAEERDSRVRVISSSEPETYKPKSYPGSSRKSRMYLRRSAWRSANDAWRWNPNATPAFSKDQVQNLHALSEMLNETEPNQLILKAEIARELGEFDNCLGLLSHPFDGRYGHAVGFIKKLAEEKVLVVRSISPAK
jgi:hypothetical protein